MKSILSITLSALFLLLSFTAQAQFTVDGQLVQRGEYRHGFGVPIPDSAKAAAFISQRARISAQYKTDRFTFYASVQDVRTWGNAPQINATDPYLSLHEAWAETQLGKHFSLKLGRQELNYDNARFLGNLDWALQGRAHDFALARFEKDNMKLHAGAGYNQDAEKLSGNTFTIPNQYKVAQFVRYENTLGSLNFSLLFWNNGQQWVQYDDPVTQNKIVAEGIRYRQTLGIPTLKYQLRQTTFSAFYYQQFGKDVRDKRVTAFDASAQVSHRLSFDEERGSGLRLTAGVEIMSGTDGNAIGSRNESFAPLYGTNHMHNGYMDLFFVGGRHEQSTGLQDLFLRLRYDVNKKLFLSANTHSFSTYAQAFDAEGNTLDQKLGYELDLTLGYLISEAVSVQSGYSQLFGSDTLAQLRNVRQPDEVQNWAYVMMIYRPNLKNKFIGLLF